MDIFPRLQHLHGLSDRDAENHLWYQKLEAANLGRYSSFLRSMVDSAIESGQLWVTEPLLKAINFHAVVGLHPEAGQWRLGPVTVGDYIPPDAALVPELMTNAINTINLHWDANTDPIQLASFALWAINSIHPFRNGNGRTARATCYFILCVKLGGWLAGNASMLERIRREPGRSEYIEALKQADTGRLDSLTQLLQNLLREQLHNALAQNK